MEKDKNNGFIYEDKDYYMIEELFFKYYPLHSDKHEESEKYNELDTDILPILPREEDIEDGYFYY